MMRGGDVLVRRVAPRGPERGLGEARLVERQLELLELLPGQLARPLGHDQQRRDRVQVLLQERAEAARGSPAGFSPCRSRARPGAPRRRGARSRSWAWRLPLRRRSRNRGAGTDAERTRRRVVPASGARSCATRPAAVMPQARPRTVRRRASSAGVLALELGDELVEDLCAGSSSSWPSAILGHELLEGDVRVDDDRLHGADGLERRVEPDGVEDRGRSPCRSRRSGGSRGRASARRGCGCDPAQEDEVA